MPSPVRVLIAALVTVLLAGCAFTVGSGDAGSGGGAPGRAADSGEGPIGDVNQDDLAADVRSAVGVSDAFWREAFPEQFRRSYRPPQVRGGYRGTSGPTCGGQPSVAFNAFYCPSEDFLAWDDNLMAAGYQQIGDAWVYLIIAHEWAHAIQARLQSDQVSVAAELQADCLAGATLFGAAERGFLEFERGDTQELAETLAAVADDYPWTEERDHGDARQRTSAFSQGAERGVAACVR